MDEKFWPAAGKKDAGNWPFPTNLNSNRLTRGKTHWTYFWLRNPSGAIFLNQESINRSFTLGKKERLKSTKLIDQLFNQGKNFSIFPYRIFYQHQPSLQNNQAGFGVSSRNFKKAVDRIRIKRLTKEAYRLQKKSWINEKFKNNHFYALFFVYVGKELPDFELVSRKMNQILEKLAELIHENHSSVT